MVSFEPVKGTRHRRMMSAGTAAARSRCSYTTSTCPRRELRLGPSLEDDVDGFVEARPRPAIGTPYTLYSRGTPRAKPERIRPREIVSAIANSAMRDGSAAARGCRASGTLVSSSAARRPPPSCSASSSSCRADWRRAVPLEGSGCGVADRCGHSRIALRQCRSPADGVDSRLGPAGAAIRVGRRRVG